MHSNARIHISNNILTYNVHIFAKHITNYILCRSKQEIFPFYKSFLVLKVRNIRKLILLFI